MRNISKRLISAVLSVAMIFSLMVVPTFAAENMLAYTLVVSEDSVTNEEERTVTIGINLDEAVDACSVGYTVKCPEELEIVGITAGENSNCNLGTADVNKITAQKYTVSWQQASMENVSVSNIGVVEIKIPENTPAKTYTIEVVEIAIAKDYSVTTLSSADTATATITVGSAGEGGEGGSTSENYEVVMNIPTPTVTEGSTFEVQITANKGFAAAEVCIQMLGATVTLKEVSSNCTAKMDWNTEDGIPRVTLAAYGLDETSPATFILTFLATDNNSTSARIQPVVVESAAFGTGASAETANLTGVVGALPSESVTITPAQHAVTLPDIFTGNTTVTHGADYTFTPETATGAYYNYAKPTVTVGGRTVEVIENADGSWTVENVTGALVISGSRTEKTYSITVNGEGEDVSEKVSYTGTPTYNTDFTFTIPADKAPGTEPGYTYALTSVTIGGSAYSFSTNGKNCTIPGSVIIGDVVITVTKTVLEANQFTVSADGTGSGDATVTATPVNKNGTAEITLTEDALYNYKVTATMGGTTATVTANGNKYTVSDVTASVVFTVKKTLKVDSAKVYDYVQLSGAKMWLVTINGNGTTQIAGKTYTYDGNNMFWSEKYQAYCYLVVAETQPDVTTGFGLVSVAAASEVTYNYDVNMADDQNTVDANDAQLVWNMYNTSTVYTGFTASVTMEKYLRADVNGDHKVDTNDALAIVNHILGITE